VKTTKESRIEERSLARSTLGVQGCAEAPRWGLGRVTSINHSHEPAQTKQQVG